MQKRGEPLDTFSVTFHHSAQAVIAELTTQQVQSLSATSSFSAEGCTWCTCCAVLWCLQLMRHHSAVWYPCLPCGSSGDPQAVTPGGHPRVNLHHSGLEQFKMRLVAASSVQHPGGQDAVCSALGQHVAAARHSVARECGSWWCIRQACQIQYQLTL